MFNSGLKSMRKRQTLLDPIHIGGMHHDGSSEPTAALGAFALEKVAFSGVRAHYLTRSGNFKTLRYRFLCLDAFWTSHNLSSKKRAEYREIIAYVQAINLNSLDPQLLQPSNPVEPLGD
jgi:hypothetical protein